MEETDTTQRIFCEVVGLFRQKSAIHMLIILNEDVLNFPNRVLIVSSTERVETGLSKLSW